MRGTFEGLPASPVNFREQLHRGTIGVINLVIRRLLRICKYDIPEYPMKDEEKPFLFSSKGECVGRRMCVVGRRRGEKGLGERAASVLR